MTAAPLPADEPERLATLAAHRILDTPNDPSFDRVVQLAAEYFDVPIALVSLVDSERQWFKAAVGVEATETSRENAFCAHAILQPEQVFVVENAELDPRFMDNPLVTGDPSIRFYAGAPIRAQNGQPLGTICVIDSKPRQLTDAEMRFLENLAGNAGSILELHRKNLILATESNCDPLTGLANRRAFNAALEAACIAAFDEDTSFGLLALDLDHFKKINDELGHDAGDKVLVEVAVRLNRVLRNHDLVARLGGDEFAMLISGPIDLTGVTAVAHRIMDVFRPEMLHGAVSVAIRTSIGVALAPLHGNEPRTLSRAADLALYAGKRAGRHSVMIAETPEGTDQLRNMSPQAALLAAVTNETIGLVWQPYAGARFQKLAGYEARPFWTPPGREAILPEDIVTLAEKGGFIAALDRLMLRQACSAAAAWPQPLPLSISWSTCWFEREDVIGIIREELERSGLPAERLALQLNAEALMEHLAQGRDYIADLRAVGVATVFNDFGVGNAALSQVCHLAFDALKLHKSFTHGIGQNRNADAVILAVTGLARSLKITVRADGVETLSQLRFLQEAGCDFIQGSLLGQPKAAISWPPMIAPPEAALLHNR